MQVVSRSWKRQGNQFYQRVFRKQRSSVDTLTLAQRGRCWISDLQYCKMMFYFLKPFSLCNLFSSVHSSVVSNTLRPHESQHARPPCPSPTPGDHSDSTSIESVMPSSHLILCRSLLLLPPIPPSIRVFSNESTLCMRWPKYWSFSFSLIPSKYLLSR